MCVYRSQIRFPREASNLMTLYRSIYSVCSLLKTSSIRETFDRTVPPNSYFSRYVTRFHTAVRTEAAIFGREKICFSAFFVFLHISAENRALAKTKRNGKWDYSRRFIFFRKIHFQNSLYIHLWRQYLWILKTIVKRSKMFLFNASTSAYNK